jgi:hypothetical protein
MKKIPVPAVLLLVLFIVLFWNVYAGSSHLVFDIDGEDIDGPLGAFAALVFTGGGLVVGMVALLLTGLLLAVLFAGLGILVVAVLALAALAVAAAVSPLLLPLLLPLAIVWLLVSRSRRNRLKSGAL